MSPRPSAHRAEGGPLADEIHRLAIAREIGVVAWHGAGSPLGMPGIAGVVVFGDAVAAREARGRGIRVREWDGEGVLRG